MTVYDPSTHRTVVQANGESSRKFYAINKLLIDMAAAGLINLQVRDTEPSDQSAIWLDISDPESGNAVPKVYDGGWVTLTRSLFYSHLAGGAGGFVTDSEMASYVAGLIGVTLQAYSANLAAWSAETPTDYSTSVEIASGYQPLDSDLTAIAALATTNFGRALLELADATALAGLVDSFFLTPAEGNAAYQPLDSDLTAIAALTTTSYGRSVLETSNASGLRTLAGLVIGTNVQAYDADLTTWAGLTPSANAQSLVTAANYAAMRSLLGLVIGTDVQAYDADLASIAALSTTSFGRALLTLADAAALTSTANAFVGDSGSGGTKGLVPAPASGDALKFLRGDGAFASIPGGGDMLAANNLSDVASAPSARANLGIKTDPFAIAASVSANALTISVKTSSGTDPSSSDPVLIPFRSATLATGTPVVRTLTSSLSLTISSGSTLGTANSTPFRIWLVVFDDGGTLRLGAINCFASTGIVALGEYLRWSSTAEGGAGAADSAGVMYTGTAVTSKAFAIIGYLEWTSGLATAGTWSAGPDTIHNRDAHTRLPGTVVAAIFSQTGAVATGGTIIPLDDTIPQSNEGDQYMTAGYTPTSPANMLQIEAALYGATTDSTSGIGFAALFVDSVADALSAVWVGLPSGVNAILSHNLRHSMRAGSASSRIFKVRAGNNVGSKVLTFNGVAGSRYFGGVMGSHIKITEIMG